jgi:hypothetical protein
VRRVLISLLVGLGVVLVPAAVALAMVSPLCGGPTGGGGFC